MRRLREPANVARTAARSSAHAKDGIPVPKVGGIRFANDDADYFRRSHNIVQKLKQSCHCSIVPWIMK